jgi:hypothetical protein
MHNWFWNFLKSQLLHLLCKNFKYNYKNAFSLKCQLGSSWSILNVYFWTYFTVFFFCPSLSIPTFWYLKAYLCHLPMSQWSWISSCCLLTSPYFHLCIISWSWNNFPWVSPTFEKVYTFLNLGFFYEWLPFLSFLL